LNFEAVDYRSRVLVNGKVVGEHTGGNDPFAIDITDAVRSGQNTLVVCVDDDTEAWQLRGKQVIKPEGIWYTQVSGIWQTVWLEEVPATYIADVQIATDAAQGSILLTADVANAQAGNSVRLTVFDVDKEIASVSAASDAALSVAVP